MFGDGDLNIHESSNYCMERGAYLVEVESSDEMDFLAQLNGTMSSTARGEMKNVKY